MTPAPPPAAPNEPLADAIGHHLARRQAEEMRSAQSPALPTTMRERLLPIATTAIAIFAPAIALVILLG